MFESISVVIPCYNEGMSIKENIHKINSYLKSLKLDFYEIITVNDGSKDDTLKKLTELKNEIPCLKVFDNIQNRGKGYTVKFGVLQSKGSLVCFTDADLSTPVEEIGRALKIMTEENYSILIGSRSIIGSNVTVKQPFYRVIMGKTFSFLTNLIVPLGGIKDTQCGFKCFTNESVLKIFPQQKMERFSFDVELIYISKLNGYKIYELPVTWVNDETSTVNPIRDSIKMFIDLWKIRLIHK